ncbi:MAG TPA: hypothetical protein VKB50_25810 [Vicinamibacterales bacterium]|nr:hypothetical protein [Vicinamibacterales bacterium]
MKTRYILACSVCALVIVVAAATLGGQAQPQPAAQGRGQPAAPSPAAPPPAQAGHPSGRLVIWGDVALFNSPTDPDNCILTNRYKRGQRVGFRMTAIDGGTGDVENSAVLVAHVTYAGKTVDASMRWRGAAGPTAPPPRGYLRSPFNLWTGSWTVPDDAPIGRISYTVTATDRFGRKATFEPFTAEASQLVIVP